MLKGLEQETGPARRHLESQAKNSFEWQAKHRKVDAIAWANVLDSSEAGDEPETFTFKEELLNTVGSDE